MKHVYPGFENAAAHRHEPLVRTRIELAPGIYAFVGYGSSNFGVIAGKTGYILIDTGDDLGGAEAALEEIATLVPGPLQAIILTHSHPDHRGGAEVFLRGAAGEIPVWGHPDFGAEQRAGKGLENVSALRAARQFGVGIPDETYPVNSLLPRFPGGKSGPPVSPNRFASNGMTPLTIDGVSLELHAIPGESTDHLAVWLPDCQVLFSGDHVYGSFPNIAPVRGGAYRDVEQWARAVRRLMEFNPKAIMFGHTHVPEQEDIMPMLASYAEALEFVYAETIGGMDAGLSADELAAAVRLPEHLAAKPYLGEFYGAVPWAVRSIFAAKMGWFDGNPTNLVPLAPVEEAERMAELAGGEAALLSAAEKALAEEDYRWAARLADCLLRLGHAPETVRRITADALEGLSRNILPVSGKNYLARSANELHSQED